MTHFSGLKIEYVPQGTLKKADGYIVGARCVSGLKTIRVDLQTLKERYEEKA
jgi:hypothetical protein